jgi:hypothetical protein
MYNFFCRLYNTTDEKVQQFIKEMTEANELIAGHSVEPLTKSVNMILPEGDHRQVNLQFKTKQAYEAMFKHDVCRKIYGRYCGGTEGNVVERKPSDLAFNV